MFIEHKKSMKANTNNTTEYLKFYIRRLLMITLAINSCTESSKNALQLIYDQSKQNGIKIMHIKPQETSVYYNNKRIPLKNYIDTLKVKEQPDLLVVELTKEGINNSIYEQIRFNLALFLQKPNYPLSKNSLYTRLFNLIQAHYYIIPETYHKRRKEYITYGWSEMANISASSVEQQIDGSLSLQCCIKPSATINVDALNTLREFAVEVPFNDVEAALAGIATMTLYGIEIN